MEGETIESKCLICGGPHSLDPEEYEKLVQARQVRLAMKVWSAGVLARSNELPIGHFDLNDGSFWLLPGLNHLLSPFAYRDFAYHKSNSYQVLRFATEEEWKALKELTSFSRDWLRDSRCSWQKADSLPWCDLSESMPDVELLELSSQAVALLARDWSMLVADWRAIRDSPCHPVSGGRINQLTNETYFTLCRGDLVRSAHLKRRRAWIEAVAVLAARVVAHQRKLPICEVTLDNNTIPSLLFGLYGCADAALLASTRLNNAFAGYKESDQVDNCAELLGFHRPEDVRCLRGLAVWAMDKWDASVNTLDSLPQSSGFALRSEKPEEGFYFISERWTSLLSDWTAIHNASSHIIKNREQVREIMTEAYNSLKKCD